MALIIPPGFMQLTIPLQHASLAREAVVTIGVDISEWGGDHVGVIDQVTGSWIGDFGEEVDSEVTIGPGRGRIGQDGGDPLAVDGTASAPGQRTASMMPPNVALLVQKRSSTGGRRGRGRMYIPWILRDEEVVETGLVDTTALAAFQVHADNFLEFSGTGGGISDPWPIVILHDSSGAGTEPSPSVITSLLVDNMVSTQRRRLGR